jgi:hypothetical protein
MKQKKVLQAVFFLERQRLHFFSAAEGVVHTLAFTSEAVQDLEVQNKKALERLLDNWLETHHIQPQISAFVIAEDAYFVHDSAQSELNPDDDEYAQFLSFVPFDEVQVKTFPLTQGSRTLAVSKDFLDPIIEVLEEREFELTCVSPDFVFAEIVGSKPFGEDTARSMIENAGMLDAYSFISKADRERKLRSEDSFTTVRFDAKILAGIGVFVVLLAVLGLLVWQTYGQEPTKTTPQAELSPPPAVVPSLNAPAADQLPSSTTSAQADVVSGADGLNATAGARVASNSGEASATVPEEIVRVRILAVTPTSEKNRALAAQLEAAGVRVSMSALGSQAPTEAELVYSALLLETQRELLREIVTIHYPELTTRASGALSGIDAEVIATE